MTAPYERANADLLERIQRLRNDLQYVYVSGKAITAQALHSGLGMYVRELESEKRREQGWSGALTDKEQAS